MRKLYILFLVLSSFCVNAQNEDDDVSLNFLTERILIKGIDYPISLSNNKIVLRGNGISIRKTINSTYSHIIKANYAKKYYIDFFKVKNNDTIFLKRERFEVIPMPKPVFEWGNLDSFYDEYKLSKDSLLNQREINLVSGWNDLSQYQWKIIGGELSFNNKYYKFEGTKINETILKEIANLKGRNSIQFIFTYIGLDRIRRKFAQEKIVEVIPNNEVEKQQITKKLDASESDIIVVNIDANRFLGKDYSDTLKIKGEPKILLRFTAPGSENHYTITDDKNKVLFDIELWSIDQGKLIDFSNYVGKYEIELKGDGGFGRIILIIE